MNRDPYDADHPLQLALAIVLVALCMAIVFGGALP